MKDDEKFVKPNKAKVRRRAMVPLVSGVADELLPFAVGQFEKAAMMPAAVEEILAERLSDESSRFNIGEVGAPPLSPEERRSALYRVAATAIALIALDERVRGEGVVAREMAQLDERGFFQKRSG